MYFETSRYDSFFTKLPFFLIKLSAKFLATLFFWITTKSYKRKLQKAKTVKVLLLIYDLSKPIIRTFWKQEWEKKSCSFFCAERVLLAPCARSFFRIQGVQDVNVNSQEMGNQNILFLESAQVKKYKKAKLFFTKRSNLVAAPCI